MSSFTFLGTKTPYYVVSFTYVPYSKHDVMQKYWIHKCLTFAQGWILCDTYISDKLTRGR